MRIAVASCAGVGVAAGEARGERWVVGQMAGRAGDVAVRCGERKAEAGMYPSVHPGVGGAEVRGVGVVAQSASGVTDESLEARDGRRQRRGVG